MIKILVVDNEKDTCDFVQSFFSQRGFKVFCALNGHHALEIVRKERPRIILLDIRMGELSGIETLKKIREIDKTVRVIMVTAVDEQEKIDAARGLDIEKYITKPLVLENLEAAVMSCVKRGKNGKQ
jgi:two-component system response regulator (stage 0 sporulation protein F)